MDNLDPTAEIDESGTVVVNGVPMIVATIDDAVAFKGSSVDPGSDDVTLSWDWDDGTPNTSTEYRANPAFPDPFPSPDVNPRMVMDIQMHTFVQACLYEVGLSTVDDDGGSATDSIWVAILGDADQIRSSGYWYQQYRQHKAQKIGDDTLHCYLDVINFASSVFSEERAASTIDEAETVLTAKLAAKQPEYKLDRQLLTAWLNFANGTVALGELIDTDGDNVPDTAFYDVMVAAETVRLNPSATKAELLAQKDILEGFNTRG